MGWAADLDKVRKRTDRCFSGTQVMKVCDMAERGLTMQRGCAYRKGLQIQVRCARLESAKQGRKTEVHWCPKIAPGKGKVVEAQ